MNKSQRLKYRLCNRYLAIQTLLIDDICLNMGYLLQFLLVIQ